MDGLQGLANYPLPRRGVIMTGLISGFTLATTRVEARAIHTDAAGLEAGETTVPTNQGSLPAYFARPAGAGPFPIVLVIEEIFGVHEYIPRSRDNPELRWGYDTEIVGNLVAVILPVLWHVLAQEGQHRGAEFPESAVALVVGNMPVHQPP